MRWLACIAAFLLACSPAMADNGQQTTTLLSPAGQPAGGAWQQWMNNSYMPTYSGPMVLDMSGACPPLAAGCTSGTAFTPVGSNEETMPETSIVTSEPDYKQTLLYEQAHVIDFRYLTDPERQAFLTLWHVALPAGESIEQFWWQGEDRFLTANPVPVMGEWFSEDYLLCATYRHLSLRQWDNLGTLVTTYPLVTTQPATRWKKVGLGDYVANGFRATRKTAWLLPAQYSSCGMIRRDITAALDH